MVSSSRCRAASAPPEGTPRIDGVELVADQDVREGIGSLARAAQLVGLPNERLDDTALAIDPASAALLADYYAFACSVLETLRGETTAEQDPSRITLWPEHFDLAFEFGSEAEGRRAAYGASPGDEEHDEPYLYVGPWTAPPAGALWRATGFDGAELLYSDLGEEPRAEALAFFRSRRDALLG